MHAYNTQVYEISDKGNEQISNDGVKSNERKNNITYNENMKQNSDKKEFCVDSISSIESSWR